jgi:hypothetical protein
MRPLPNNIKEDWVEVDDETCSAIADPSSGARSTVDIYKLFPTALDQELSINTKIVVASIDNRPLIFKEEAARDVDVILKTVNKRYPGKSALLTETKLRSSDYQDFCALNLEFYNQLLTLSPERAANILRYINAN